MRAAYLLFDLGVIAGPAALSLVPGATWWVHRWGMALLALVVGGAPWLVWDVAVAGNHWDFNPSYVLGLHVAGLPLEEWGFFLAVPFACLFSWEVLVKGPKGHPLGGLRWAAWLGALAAPIGLAVWWWDGPAYTALALGSVGSPFVVDRVTQTGLFENPRAWAYLALVAGFTLVFNNVLTGLPIVTYNESAQLGVRLGTMPLEDLGFGLGHLGVVLVVFERLRRRVD